MNKNVQKHIKEQSFVLIIQDIHLNWKEDGYKRKRPFYLVDYSSPIQATGQNNFHIISIPAICERGTLSLSSRAWGRPGGCHQ